MELKYLNIIFLGLLSICAGCDKNWLDQKPDSSAVVPETLADFQAMLDNTSNMNGSFAGLGQLGADDYYVPDANYQTLQDLEKQWYTWRHEIPFSSYEGGGEWFLHYQKVLTANLVLDGLNKIDIKADPNTFNDVKGQALFQRSLNFYQLAQVFAPPYVASTSANELGIPLRLESNINIRTNRASLKETYDQIIHDLNTAKGLLPDIAVYKTRGSKCAAFGLLARCYLSMREYEKAKVYADSCLQIQNTLLDYNRLNAALSYPVPMLNAEVIFHLTLANYASNPVFSRVSTEHVQLYAPDDLRRRVFFGASGEMIMFKGHYHGGRLNFGGLAVDELLLIRAEGFAREGDVPGALADLNTLLQARWDENTMFVPLTASTAAQALDLILVERKKELLLRGLRWTDLRRLNQEPGREVTLNRTVAGTAYTLEPNSYKYTYPIPNDIIQQTGIPQNKGY